MTSCRRSSVGGYGPCRGSPPERELMGMGEKAMTSSRWQNCWYEGVVEKCLAHQRCEESAQRALSQRIRIFLFEPPLSVPSLQGETRGREGLMRGQPGWSLSARMWYRPALWHHNPAGQQDTSSRSSAITGSPSSSAIRVTGIAMCRLSLTRCSAVALQSRATPRNLCPHCLEEKRVRHSAARAASASPAARCTSMSGCPHRADTL